MTLRASLGFCHLSLAFCILSSLLANGSTFVVAIFSGEGGSFSWLSFTDDLKPLRDNFPQDSSRYVKWTCYEH